jgi:hypothetical protein
MNDIRDEALSAALEALRLRLIGKDFGGITINAIDKVKHAMAQPATQVAEARSGSVAPGDWSELTDEEAMTVLRLCGWNSETTGAAVNWQLGFARAVGAAVKAKNVAEAV